MVDGTDSQFQAFARLSLANDSDALLERLICVAPKTHDEKWLSAKDSWDVSLWGIYPSCQVAGVGENDTVILDGCRSAAIHWDKFGPVYTKRSDSWKRFFAKVLVRCSPLLILIGGGLASMGSGSASTSLKRSTSASSISTRSSYYDYYSSESSGPSSNPVAAAILLVVGLITWLASPYLSKIIYGGKFWNQQAWLFGFKGHLDIGTIESLIFGYNMFSLNLVPFRLPFIPALGKSIQRMDRERSY